MNILGMGQIRFAAGLAAKQCLSLILSEIYHPLLGNLNPKETSRVLPIIQLPNTGWV